MGCLGFFVVPPKNAAVFTESSKKSSRWKKEPISVGSKFTHSKFGQMNGNPRLVGPVSVISDCMSTYNDTCFYKRRWCLPLFIWLHGCTSTVCLTKKYSIGLEHIKENTYLSLDIHLSIVFGVHLDMICPKEKLLQFWVESNYLRVNIHQ